MKNSETLLTSTKAAIMTAAGATSSGVTTYLGWLPDVLGLLATFAGLILSVVLVISHIKKGRREERRAELEEEKLKLEIAAMVKKPDVRPVRQAPADHIKP